MPSTRSDKEVNMENVGNIDEERGDKAIVDTLLSDQRFLRQGEQAVKRCGSVALYKQFFGYRLTQV